MRDGLWLLLQFHWLGCKLQRRSVRDCALVMPLRRPLFKSAACRTVSFNKNFKVCKSCYMRLLAIALLLTTLQNILHKFIFIYTSYYAGLYLWVKRRWFYIFIRVQAENENFSRGTFRNGFDPRIDLAPFFLPPDIILSYHQGLLCSPSGRL